MKKFRKTLSLILAMILCLSLFAVLTGCGDKTEAGQTQNEPSSGKPGQQQAEPQPEFVYAAEYIPVSAELNQSLNNLVYSNGRFLANAYGMIADNTPEGVVPEWEGQYWEYGSILYWVDLDGSVERIEGYTPLELPEDFSGSSYMQSMQAAPDGRLVTLEEVYSYWYDGPEDIEMYSEAWYNAGYYEYEHNEETYYIRTLNPDGSEISRFDLSELSKAAEENGSWFYPYSFVVGGDGNYYLNCDQSIYILDSTGKLLKTIGMDGWTENMIRLNDGSVLVTYYGERECMAKIDPATLELDTENAVPVTNAYNMIPGDDTYDYYYTNGTNLMGGKLSDGSTEKVLNWINCDVSENGNVCVLPDGRIVTTEYEWDKDYINCTNRLVVLSKVPSSSLPQKVHLTYATQYLGWEARSMIVEFNRSSADYRIDVKDYSEYNTEEDYSAGLTKLTTEILAGNVPDIIDLNGMPYAQFASKGLLEDLYPYLDSDPELSRDSIFPSVLKALESDGKLYRTAAGFELNTVVGAASIVGEGPGWTLNEFKAALAKMPEGCTPFSEYTTRDSILSQCLAMEMDNLVDWETGKCYFDTPMFTDILKFAAEFPETFDWDNYEWTEDDDETQRIATGRQMLMQTYLYDFQSYQMYRLLFGGDATYIGYPVSEGVGNVLMLSDSGCAISAKCADKDAAWQFVRTTLTQKYQEENIWDFPTNTAAFNTKLKEAMTPEYMRDENGNFVLDENGNKIEISKGGWGMGSEVVEIYAMTQKEADDLIALIGNTTRVQNYDEDIMPTVMEEAAAFFAGQKSAEEVGRLTQSKLNIYINEQR